MLTRNDTHATDLLGLRPSREECFTGSRAGVFLQLWDGSERGADQVYHSIVVHIGRMAAVPLPQTRAESDTPARLSGQLVYLTEA